jgi:SAM-dependent methyltransferase
VCDKDVYLAGVDVNPQLVDFCKHNIRHADVRLSKFWPPLDFPTAHFDLIYAVSVFTHLTLSASVCWAGELARLLKSGDVLVTTFHGTYYLNEYEQGICKVNKEGVRMLEERGYYLHLHTRESNNFLGSSDYAAYHTTAFMKSLFKDFKRLRPYPGISHGSSDLVFYQDGRPTGLEAMQQQASHPCRERPMVSVGIHTTWLKVQTHDFGLRNSIEQWFSHLKARTKRFYNNFPNGSSLKSVQTYFAIHTATYNLLLGLT